MTRNPLVRSALDTLPVYAPAATSCAIDLRDNVNLWGAPPCAMDALRQTAITSLTQYPGVGAEALTSRIAASLGVQPDEVSAGCGSDDLLDGAFRAFAEPGMRVVHPAPTFSMVPIFAQLNGLVPVAVPLRADGAADVNAMLAASPRIVYLCSPNNPTGTVTPSDAVRWILRESSALVILDGAYAEFSPDLEDFLAESPRLERLLVLRTFSKAWGLAGLRVGYAVGAAPLMRALKAANGPYKVNALAEQAACVALDADGEWMRACAREAIASRERLMQELIARGHAPLRSAGNFVAIPVSDARALAARIAEGGVAVRAFVGLPVYGDLLRVGVGPWPVMEAFLSALREATIS